MKLDAKHLRYLSSEEFRTLLSIELGMRNHELVPTSLIERLADLKHGGTRKTLKLLARKKLIHHDSKVYDGYKLNYLGYDYLALHTFVKRGSCVAIGGQIGVGKESDVFVCMGSDDKEHVLKLHRLGRISFRTIKNKRDYLKNRKSANWLYLSKLAAMKEFAFMKALYDMEFPVPQPIEHNRHCVVMERVDGFPLYQVKEMADPHTVGMECLNLIVKLAEYGLIHGDFNEFNLMIKEDGSIVVIDFPQMVSTDHKNADYYFDRDVECIHSYFEKKHSCYLDYYPKLSDVVKHTDLDVVVSASGFSKEKERELRKLQKEQDLKLSTVEDDDSDDEAIEEERDELEHEEDLGNLRQEMEEILKNELESNFKATKILANQTQLVTNSEKLNKVVTFTQETKEIKQLGKLKEAIVTNETQIQENIPKKLKVRLVTKQIENDTTHLQSFESTKNNQKKVEGVPSSISNEESEVKDIEHENPINVSTPSNNESIENNDNNESLSVLQQALKDAKDKKNLKANELLQQLIRLKVKRAQESKRKQEKYSTASKGNSKKGYKKSKSERKTTQQLLDENY